MKMRACVLSSPQYVDWREKYVRVNREIKKYVRENRRVMLRSYMCEIEEKQYSCPAEYWSDLRRVQCFVSGESPQRAFPVLMRDESGVLSANVLHVVRETFRKL